MRKIIGTGFVLFLGGSLWYGQSLLNNLTEQFSGLTGQIPQEKGKKRQEKNTSHVPPESIEEGEKVSLIREEKKALNAPEAGKSGRLLSLSPEEWNQVNMIQARYASGDYQTCLEMIRTGLGENGHTDDFAGWLMEQLEVVLVSTGWMAIKTGQCEKAIEDLKAAEEAGGKTPEIYSGLAYCYHHLRMAGQAKEAMEKYLREKPDNLKLQVLYSDILESSLEFDGAVRALEKAASISTDMEQKKLIARKLAGMRKKASISRNQAVRESSHFTLLYPGEISPEVVGRVLDILEQGHALLVEQYQFRELLAPVEVVLYPHQSFQDVMAHGPGWMSGVYNGRIRVPLTEESSDEVFWKRLTSVLHHELVHAIFHEMSGRRTLPTWLEEGVAQRFTCHGPECDVVSQKMGTGVFYSQEEFEGSFTKFGEARARSIYHQSLYLILVLEAINPDAIRLISDRVRPQGPLNSDELLRSLDLGFSDLLERARLRWEARDPLTMTDG